MITLHHPKTRPSRFLKLLGFLHPQLIHFPCVTLSLLFVLKLPQSHLNSHIDCPSFLSTILIAVKWPYFLPEMSTRTRISRFLSPLLIDLPHQHCTPFPFLRRVVLWNTTSHPAQLLCRPIHHRQNPSSHDNRLSSIFIRPRPRSLWQCEERMTPSASMAGTRSRTSANMRPYSSGVL